MIEYCYLTGFEATQKVGSNFVCPLCFTMSVRSYSCTIILLWISTVSIIMSSTTNHVSSYALKRVKPYRVPKWAKGFLQKEPEQGRIRLGNLPTPLHQVPSTGVEGSILERLAAKNINLFIKRDDMTGGTELGGNKIRKLEFLMADALKKGCDSVVTIGGEQSNHCRATAAAARMVGMEPHLILRTKRAPSVHEGKEEFGVIGNVLFDRMVGSKIYTCTPGEYGRIGSSELVARLCHHLKSENKKPYGIPVGGSNALGTWGYIEAVDEILTQWRELQQSEEFDSPGSLDHILCACGSGGTTAGIACGIAIAHGAQNESAGQQLKPIPTVHAVGVCDNPSVFYNDVSRIADDMGIKLTNGQTTEEFIRQHLMVYQGKGLGYAVSTKEELDFVTQFSLETGITLDPVYSGKALYNFVTEIIEGGEQGATSIFEGKNILFVHTGGSLGLFEKEDDLLPKLQEVSPVRRLDLYGKDLEGSVDISNAHL